MKTFYAICAICFFSMAIAGEVKADEDSAYDENPNYADTNIEDLSPANRKLYEVVGYMFAGGACVMLINSFQSNRNKKKKKQIEKYQQNELRKFEARFAAGLTKWNTASEKKANTIGCGRN